MSHYNFQTKLPLGTAVFGQFLGLEPPTQCQATYVWIDGTGENLRSKTRTFNSVPQTLADYPVWSYDGSSTGQANQRNSETFLYPVAVYRDPFLGPNARLVLCDTYNHLNEPTKTNHRAKCLKVMNAVAGEKAWFAMEQEYLLLDMDNYPLGWPKHGFPEKQGKYYCAVGADRIFGREIVETHYRALFEYGFEHWRHQCRSDSCDQMWMSRYVLHRVCEQFGVIATLHPKPAVTAGGDWNGAGGLKVIEEAIKKLERHHSEHLLLYDPNNGTDNLQRLSGRCETSSVEKFTWGVANRQCSIRIPQQTSDEGKGYFEDRRPSSNCDPYMVTYAIASGCLL
ncbi:Glutamine synthetase [Aphelenchoides bicaudatus]|nr:Glutamine synthetase [Aphelenchoides bicaudatus]